MIKATPLRMLLRGAGLALGCMLLALAAHAQDAGGVDVSVTIYPPGYDVEGRSDLVFGVLEYGVASTVQPTDALAAEWWAGTFQGPTRQVQLDFVLPAQLRHTELGTASVLTMHWNDGSFGRVESVDRVDRAPETFNPTSTYTIWVGAGRGRPNEQVDSFGTEILVRLGGTVEAPGTDVAAGTYSRSVTLYVTELDA